MPFRVEVITVPLALPQIDRAIHILAIEADPIMLSGLVTCLNRFPDLQVVAEAETTFAALKILTDRSTEIDLIDTILLGLPVVPTQAFSADRGSGLSFCQQVKTIAPNLPILLLASPQNEDLLAAFQMGIAGCWIGGDSILNLVGGIREVAAGQTSWAPELVRKLTSTTPTSAINPLGNLQSSSIKQIETALKKIDVALNEEQFSLLDRSILLGRKRELKTALWFVKQFLPAPTSSNSKSTLPSPPARSIVRSDRPETPTSTAKIAPTGRQTTLFDCITAKLQSSLENFTPSVLEIDILRQEKKRELFYLILRQFEGLLDELRFSQVTAEQLSLKQSTILQDLWASVATDFFGRYHTISIDDLQVEIVPVILQDAPIVSTEILDKIPQPIELLKYLLFQHPLMIDNVICPAGTPPAEDRACALLENLTINIANAVMQPLLDRFADLESIKVNFYDRRLLSSREIQQFRNDVSWRYRIDRYLGEPQAIFESQYRLLIFTDIGIERIAIYAPRPQELSRLVGIPLVVTLALETRDALAPRFRSATTLIGNSIVYILTEIIGRGIGLIGRGIVKGVGNIWQESNRNRRD